MGNIWSVYHEGEDHGGIPWAGIWAVGDLLADGLHPWGRANPWAYDGAIYGYREFQALGTSNYWLLGQRMFVTNPSAESDATYAAELATLNAGCNWDWRATAGVMNPEIDLPDPTSITIRSHSDGGDSTSIIKCAMACWGIVRDILTFNSPGPDQALVSSATGVDGGYYNYTATIATPAGRDQWAIWAGEVIALWIA